MNKHTRRYGIAVIAVVFATFLRHELAVFFSDRFPFVLAFCAVATASLFGRRPGILAVGLGALSTWFFILPPPMSFMNKPAPSFFQLAAFVFAGLFVAILTGSLRKANDQVRDREAQLLFMAAAVPEILFTASAGGEFETISERFTEYSGRTLSDVGSTGWLEILHSDEKNVTLAEWKAAVNSMHEFRSVSRLRHKDGGYRWFQCRAIPMRDKQRRIIRWFGVCTDIHDRKLLEEKLARSNEDLERFAFAASHDLQEPLRTIGNFSELLVRRNPAKDEESQYFIEQIKLGVHRMRELIDASLEFSRVISDSAGRRIKGNLDEPLSEAIWALQGVVESAGAEIQREAMPEALMDPPLIARVFQNLISNAIKFRRDQPPVIRIGARRTDEECTIYVSDNGIGMTTQNTEIIFQAFRRLNTKDAYPGSGLGLATVKRIIELHQGRIWVESAPGEGSTFFFTLPNNSDS